jgi:hypothetical protein
MPDVIFHHRKIDHDLKLQTGANQVQWSYGLNTQTMPTYGGEVVQILSAYVDDISIQGDVRTYRKLEQIYKWFVMYFQIATQGINNDKLKDYDEHPVHMYYPERHWHIMIKPTALPGFREATDVTAPAFQIQASVVESDPAMDSLTMKEAAKRGFDFTQITAGIGWDDSNPWTDPAAAGSKYDPVQVTSRITDWYQNLIPSYLDHSFDDLFKTGFLGSKPLLDNSSGNKDNGKGNNQNNNGKGGGNQDQNMTNPRTDGLPHSWVP